MELTPERATAMRQEYVNHLNMKNKHPIEQWEYERKRLHDNIFKSLDLDRHSDAGQKFSKEFDESILIEINSSTEQALKYLGSASTLEELERRTAKLKFIEDFEKKSQLSAKQDKVTR